MSITYEQAERVNLKDELAPLNRIKDAKRSGVDLTFERDRMQIEELTDIAEAIDHLYLESRFEYDFDGHNVVLKDGTPLVTMYHSGVETANRLARRRPEFQFEHERRQADEANQQLIDAMMRGEVEATMIIELSAYPEEAETKHGRKHLEDNGYKPNLRRGMVRIAKKENDRTLSLTTFSLDNSSLELFQDLQASLGLVKPGLDTLSILQNPRQINTNLDAQTLAGQMIDFYDAQLQRETSIKHRRGRSDPAEVNSLELLKNSGAVLDYYFRQLELLGEDWAGEQISAQLASIVRTILNWRDKETSSPLLPEDLMIELSEALLQKRLTDDSVSIIKRALEISTWATIVGRLDRPDKTPSSVSLGGMLNYAYQAEASGQRMVGCGGATSLFEMGRPNALRSIFGSNLMPEAHYSFNRKMHCVVCQRPPKRDQKTQKVEHKKWCGPCGICQKCDTKLKK